MEKEEKYWTGEEKNRKGKGGKGKRRGGDDGKGLRGDGGRVWEEGRWIMGREGGERGIEEEYNINKYMCMCNNI